MRIIEEMENEQLIIVMKGKVKLNIECKCCIKAKMSSNIYRDLETIKEAIIMVLWHIMDFIGPIKPMSKGGKRRLTNMSNIYMQEPATKGKVVMKTTVGDIELELWAKETAKAYRNFIQLCMEGYWDDTIFHRIIKGFITQDGDPTGTGEGGKIYGEPFKDDFHTRLRSCRRDLIAVANAGKMTMVSNTSLFLILHQICRINIQSLVELLVNLYINDKPLYPPRLIKPIILNNPFSDIIPRIIVQECEEVKDSSETQTAGVKYKSYMFAEFSPGRVILCYEKFCYRHFNLLSFGEEADEDEEESVILNKKFSGKGKSSHDHSTDPKLSSQPAVEPPGLANKKRKEGRSSDWESDAEVKTQEELEVVKKEKEAMKKRIKNTLRDTKKEPKKVQNYKIDDAEDDKDIKENE
ncbi:Peptidyl-prolyl cis-trans isomerase CWC27 like protein [Eufriesea mexicana]|uniref:Spliceosome-associated protein CWC27 homolog n=1 Tax=Eufriesea mexicana TaxID=516756 RepID=A0A310ST65_9HYME|nr:Peptidyl-prolyl cis-trans isomerase CWC27 like protein [Eufriesea mexicana]